jgi:hypothetical protein
MSQFSTTAFGISPFFTVTSEEFVLDFLTTVSPVVIDGVPPPYLGDDGGYSYAHDLVNQWFPWIDEKIVEPKYDGVCQYLGLPSNRPSYIKDYHILSLFRATDYILTPRYVGLLQGVTNTPTPIGPPPEEMQ